MARNYTHINGAQRVGLEVTEKEPTVNLSVSNWLRKKNDNCWESIGEEAEGNSGMKPTKETSTSIFIFALMRKKTEWNQLLKTQAQVRETNLYTQPKIFTGATHSRRYFTEKKKHNATAQLRKSRVN